MIHRYVDLTVPPVAGSPPYTILEDSGDYNIWRVLDGTPTRITTGSLDERTDPVLSPDGTKIAYVQRVAGERVIKCVNSDGSGDTTVDDSGAADKLHPYWKHDSSRIVYSVGNVIRSRLPDGTGSVDHFTVGTGTLRRPQYNRDGTLIGYQRVLAGDDDIRVVAPDGTGDALVTTVPFTVSNGRGFVWGHLSDVIVYGEGLSGGVNGDWYKIDADGTGKTQLNTGTPGATDRVAVTKFGLTDDDQTLFAFWLIGPQYRLYQFPMDATGESAVSPNRDADGQVGIGQAYVFGGRVWFGQRSPGKVESVALDGSDYTVEHDIAAVGDDFFLGTGFESNL